MTQNPLALIIEDDPEQIPIFAEALRLAEYAIEVIQDGGAALYWLQRTTPDVVILDLHLPQVSGKDILQRIRADARLVETRVIIATADPSAAEMLHQQADLVLIKPISFIQLRDLAIRLRPRDLVNVD